ncbi:MAG: hypothetical protein WBF17_14525 [Phycisphaerae bacterium]
MLKQLDKFAPYLVILSLGYLTHSTMTESGIPAASAKKPPAIEKGLLNPTLVDPQAGASPVGRDPFEVDWASYLPEPVPEPASQPASQPATRATTVPASKPAVVEVPPLPKRFTAVITALDFQMAIIDNQIYRPGSLIGGADPQRCWRVETIERKRVTLRFGELIRVLTISEDAPPADDVPEDDR